MMVERVFVIAATAFALLSVTMKKSWQIFVVSAIANLLMCLSYLVLGGAMSGMFISLVGALQCIVAAVYALKDEAFNFKLKIVFFVLYTAFGISNIRAVYDLLPFVASMLCMTALFQKKKKKIRLFNIMNSITWIIYNFIVGSTALYTQILFLIMNTVTMITYSKIFLTNIMRKG